MHHIAADSPNLGRKMYHLVRLDEVEHRFRYFKIGEVCILLCQINRVGKPETPRGVADKASRTRYQCFSHFYPPVLRTA